MPLNRNQDFMFEDTTTLTTNAKSLKGALNEVNASLADSMQKQAAEFAIEKYQSYATKDGSGNITDWTPAITQALSQMPDGSTLKFLGQDYKISTQNLVGNKPIRIVGQGRKTRFVLNDPTIGVVFKFGFDSNEGSKVSITTSVNKGDESIVVSSTSGINTGDYLLVLSDEIFSAADTNNYKGEILRVRDVNTGTNTIDFYSRIQDSYSASSGASYKKVNMVDGVIVEKVSFYNPNPNTTQASFMSFNNVINVTVRDIHMKNGDNAGITVSNVVGGNIENIIAEDMTNNDQATRFGYGIQVYRATQQLTISNCHFKRCRHGVTINAMDNNYGLPRHIIVANCTGADGSHAQFDCHPQGEYITFIGCSVQGARVFSDPNSPDYGDSLGFQIRSRRTRLIGCEVNRADNAIFLDGYAKEIEIIDCRLMDSKSSGIKFSNNYTSLNGNVSKVVIKGNTIMNSGDSAIIIDQSTSDVLVQNNFIDGAGQLVANKSAIWVSNIDNIKLINNVIVDTAATPTTVYGIYLTSGSTNCIAYGNIIKNMTTGTVTDANTSSTTNVVVLGLNTSTLEFNIPKNLLGGTGIGQGNFDISSASNSVPLRLQRNSNAQVQFMGGTGAPVAWVDSVGSYYSNGYIRTGNLGSLPTASATYQGLMIRIQGGTGVADKFYICMKTASDTYSWVQLATG